MFEDASGLSGHRSAPPDNSESAIREADPTSDASDIISSLIIPALEKRRAAWFRLLEDIIRRSSESGKLSDCAKIADREDFISMITLVTEIAIRNHRREKLQALKNLFESYMDSAPEDESIFTMFAHDVDRFSLWHLRILSLLGDPRRWAEMKGVHLPEWSFGSAANLLEYSYTELEGARGFYDPIVRDLYLSGLLSADNLHRTVPFIQLFDPLTTPLGNLFIKLTRLSEVI